jgi:hypothetical protein
VHSFDYRNLEINLKGSQKTKYLDLLKKSYMPFLVTEHFSDLILSQKEPYRDQLMNIVLPFVYQIVSSVIKLTKLDMKI